MFKEMKECDFFAHISSNHLGPLQTDSMPVDVSCDIYKPKEGCFHLQIFPFKAVQVIWNSLIHL